MDMAGRDHVSLDSSDDESIFITQEPSKKSNENAPTVYLDPDRIPVTQQGSAVFDIEFADLSETSHDSAVDFGEVVPERYQPILEDISFDIP